MKHVAITRLSLAAAGFALAAIPAAHADALGDAIAAGKANVELRYRLENVDQANLTRTANASTLRTRLRFVTGDWNKTSGTLEVDNVSRLQEGDEDRYNDGRNGMAAYPNVIDPDGTDLNQAFIKYAGIDKTAVLVGRQRVNLDNQRFIGSVGWRQNEQTLDSAVVAYSGIDRLTATYAFVTAVHRINGPDPAGAGQQPAELDGESHALNLKYAAADALNVTVYDYLIDVDNAAAASSQTLGLRLTGKIPVGGNKLGYTAELAQQSDYSNQPIAFDADYNFLEATFGNATWEAQLGYEVLGADTSAKLKSTGAAAPTSFMTPLATLHKFNGWADQFLATPAAGLVDTYVGANLNAAGLACSLAYHTFGSDTGGVDYGTEIDAQVAKTIAKRYTLTLKYADYQKDTFANDTTKLWLMAEAKF